MGDREPGLEGPGESPMKHHPIGLGNLTLGLESGRRTVAAGQFYWGGILPKSNGGVRRLAQPGWHSGVEYMDISQPYCETYKSSSRESGPK